MALLSQILNGSVNNFKLFNIFEFFYKLDKKKNVCLEKLYSLKVYYYRFLLLLLEVGRLTYKFYL